MTISPLYLSLSPFEKSSSKEEEERRKERGKEWRGRGKGKLWFGGGLGLGLRWNVWKRWEHFWPLIFAFKFDQVKKRVGGKRVLMDGYNIALKQNKHGSWGSWDPNWFIARSRNKTTWNSKITILHLYGIPKLDYFRLVLAYTSMDLRGKNKHKHKHKALLITLSGTSKKEEQCETLGVIPGATLWYFLESSPYKVQV